MNMNKPTSFLIVALLVIGCFIVLLMSGPATEDATAVEGEFVPVCAEVTNQSSPAIHGDIIVWMDERNGMMIVTANMTYICTTSQMVRKLRSPRTQNIK